MKTKKAKKAPKRKSNRAGIERRNAARVRAFVVAGLSMPATVRETTDLVVRFTGADWQEVTGRRQVSEIDPAIAAAWSRAGYQRSSMGWGLAS